MEHNDDVVVDAYEAVDEHDALVVHVAYKLYIHNIRINGFGFPTVAGQFNTRFGWTNGFV